MNNQEGPGSLISPEKKEAREVLEKMINALKESPAVKALDAFNASSGDKITAEILKKRESPNEGVKGIDFMNALSSHPDVILYKALKMLVDK